MSSNKFYIGDIYPEYDGYVSGASYIGKPIDNTIMFVTKKVAHLVQNLKGYHNCLVFAECGICPDEEIAKNNLFIYSQYPQREYIKFANAMFEERQRRNEKRHLNLVEGGYYIGENVEIGEGAYIEPGCIIGHDVVIGKNASILARAIIKDAVIGDDFLCNEGACIGTNAFTISEDENGNKIRIPSLGKVVIGNSVEVGVNDDISRGTAGDTIIENFVKIGSLVHIGHDAHLCENVEVAPCVIIGGFSVLDEKAYVGLNSTVRNRVRLGKNSLVGMGTNVLGSVDDDDVVVGNPAKSLKSKQ